MSAGDVDVRRLSAHHRSDAAARRAARRHRAERRLKAYGIIAILLAAAALVTLVSSIAVRTAGVLWEHYLVLPVTLDLEEQDLERARDPNPRLVPSLGDPLQEALEATRAAELERSERRQLNQLLSGEAALELGRLVKDDPALVGETITFPALLDDTFQMYLDGEFGELEAVESPGPLTLAREDDAVRLEVAPGALAGAREALVEMRRARAQLALAEAARQQFAVEAMEAQLEAAETEEARQQVRERLEGYAAARDEARARAEALLALAADPDATFTLTEQDPSVLIAVNDGWLRATEIGPEHVLASELVPLDSLAPAETGDWQAHLFPRPEAERGITDLQIVWLEEFAEAGRIEAELNTRLLLASDSSNPELAGIRGAAVGSFWTMLVTFALAFPIGVLAAIYLEEFAPRNRFTDFVEVNINNLAAVPSIVFGLLGLAIFVGGLQFQVFGTVITLGGFLPRSSPAAGGVVLALMTLPTIIIAGRAAIRAVPPSIREAALGLGASRLQTSTHHVLPLAMPGVMTGAIIGMAQALGETAPLLLIGMNSFIQEPPDTPLEPGNVLPTLIYQWNSYPERLFNEKTAAAITVLLLFLVAMNALAVFLRKRFERRW